MSMGWTKSMNGWRRTWGECENVTTSWRPCKTSLTAHSTGNPPARLDCSCWSKPVGDDCPRMDCCYDVLNCPGSSVECQRTLLRREHLDQGVSWPGVG